MSLSVEEIARDIVVAWLHHNRVSNNVEDAANSGAVVGKVYMAVLQAVQEGKERCSKHNRVTGPDTLPWQS